PKRVPRGRQAPQKTVQPRPTQPRYTNLGYLPLREPKDGEANATVENAPKFNDKEFLVWGNLALAYQGLNQKEKVSAARDQELALLEKAVASNPRDGQMQSYLGLVYAQKKLRDKALLRLQSALV